MILDKPWWPWVKRGVGLAFFLLVATLLVRYARNVDWGEVKHSLLDLPPRVLLHAALFAATSHLLYSCFDLVGRQYTGHGLAVGKVMQVNFISYAFNLNMGSAVGGVGFRYRLYSRYGLRLGDITRVVTLSMITNWVGFLLQAGLAFALVPLALPPHWKLDSEGLQYVGMAMVAVALCYVVACGWSRRREWKVRGHQVLLPWPRLAAAQVALSCTNWMVIAATIFTLLQGRVPYVDVLTVFLIAAMAGVIVRVPAGLGVLEAVFIGLLSHRVPEGHLLGALLAYRAIYYIVPLAIAALMYLVVELKARKAVAVA